MATWPRAEGALPERPITKEVKFGENRFCGVCHPGPVIPGNPLCASGVGDSEAGCNKARERCNGATEGAKPGLRQSSESDGTLQIQSVRGWPPSKRPLYWPALASDVSCYSPPNRFHEIQST